MKTSDSIDKIALALHAFQTKITPPTKNRTANTGKYEYGYADLSSLFAHCKDAMSAHGLVFCSAGLVSRLVHTSGQWIETEFAFDLANLNPQQIGAVLSYARRYCFQGLLGINADEDDDAAAASPANAAGTTHAPAKPSEVKPSAPKPPAKAQAAPLPSYGAEPPLVIKKLGPGESILHPPGPQKLDVAAAMPEGWAGEVADGAEPVRFIGYAQPKTLSNGAVKMGVRTRFADGTEGWADSWDAPEHKGLQDAILAAKKAKQDGVDVYAVLEREPKKDGNGEWIKIKEWKVA